MENKKYGDILIINTYKNSSNKTEANCLCVCGNKCIILLTHLKIGRIKRCCECSKKKRKENIKSFYEKTPYTKHHNFTGYKDIPMAFFNRIKTNAINRKLDFNITIEYIYNLYLLQDKKCYFTNIDLILDPKKCNASIDRIDSNIGYIEGNIIWVYKPINLMKSDYSCSKFIELCCLISKGRI